jgi:hypothetical protein
LAKKIKDLAVSTGSYTNGYGEEKRRYMNCGAVMEGDDGGMFIMLNRYIDYAALPNPKGGESILVSAFDLRERTDQTTAKPVASAVDLDDDIPGF